MLEAGAIQDSTTKYRYAIFDTECIGWYTQIDNVLLVHRQRASQSCISTGLHRTAAVRTELVDALHVLLDASHSAGQVNQLLVMLRNSSITYV